MKVDIYWNLHKNCYSIRHRGKVVAHADMLMIRDASFVVQPAGNEYVRRTGKKVVHAFVRGHLVAHISRRTLRHGLRNGHSITYNPKRDTTFVRRDTLEPVHKSEGLTLLVQQNGKPSILDFDPCLMPHAN